VLLFANVEVTEAMTWETVIVLVSVAVEVMVVVEEVVSAMASRGKRRAADIVEMRILHNVYGEVSRLYVHDRREY